MESSTRILVVGDIMLDRYVAGSVTRISPEAPVPIVKVEREWSALGGAANVASNVVALGAKAVLIGLIGDDSSGEEVITACQQAGIEPFVISGDQPTIVKTRVVSGQQIVRFDREEPLEWSEKCFTQLNSRLENLITDCDIVLLSDYAKGTLSDQVLKLVFKFAVKHSKRVLVDPKRADWNLYRGAFLVTPNLAELAVTDAGKDIRNNDQSVVKTCNELRHDFGVENIVATRSSYGMTLVGQDQLLNIPTRALEVFDVSGAGDTVLAAFGVSLAEGRTVSESAFIANAAAGIVVSKRGTAVVHRSELNAFTKRSSKLISRKDILQFKEDHASRKVVFTNGCFDVLHEGHRKLLKEARDLGDILIVAINSDDSIKRLKGQNRPINSIDQRVEALAALPAVDAIIVFMEDTPLELITELKPNVLVKGGDYARNEVVGHELVDELVIIPLVQGISTSQLWQG